MDDISYSDKYEDKTYEYRHVILPSSIASKLPHPPRLLTESEWRGLGVQQSQGWIHYEIHRPEPHILLFRRPKPCNSLQKTSGRVGPPLGKMVSDKLPYSKPPADKSLSDQQGIPKK